MVADSAVRAGKALDPGKQALGHKMRRSTALVTVPVADPVASAPCRFAFVALRRMNPSTFDAISTVLVEQFHVAADTVRRDASLEQLGLDSLALMEFVFAMEDRFDVRIPEDRLDPRQAGVTLEQLAVLLDEAVAAKPGKDASAP